MALLPNKLKQAWQLLVDPYYTRYLAPLQLLGDGLLCILIIRFIPYTEIDWKTYMQQISLYRSGERLYSNLTGSTGPLVYPAAHVHVYNILYNLTDRGQDIYLAQYLFGALYLLCLALVMSTYRKAGVPYWVFPLLSTSKRMHSIFVLRMFNDCFAVGLLFAAVAFWQRRWWVTGSILFSFGLGVKMSLLLALPAVGVVLWLGMGRDRAVGMAVVMGQVQILLAYPFIGSMSNAKSYIMRAFEFTRVFMFKWTVNWRFVGEETFLSRAFSYSLLALHLVLLVTFGLTRWFTPADWTLPEAINNLLSPPSKETQARISRRVTPDFTLTSVLTAIIIGCLCARSLHYQFFVYITWSTPFLLWRSGLHPILVYAICWSQEWAWNVYPSTAESSMVVVGCLAATLVCVLVGTSPYFGGDVDRSKQKATLRRTSAEHKHVE